MSVSIVGTCTVETSVIFVGLHEMLFKCDFSLCWCCLHQVDFQSVCSITFFPAVVLQLDLSEKNSLIWTESLYSNIFPWEKENSVGGIQEDILGYVRNLKIPIFLPLVVLSFHSIKKCIYAPWSDIVTVLPKWYIRLLFPKFWHFSPSTSTLTVVNHYM